MSERRFRRLAANRDFTILWAGETVSQLGSSMSLFVFPLLGYALTGSAVVAALAEAALLLGLVGALLPAGAVADRCDRRRVMMAASFTGMLAYGSLAVAGILDVLTIEHLVAAGFVSGVCAGFFMPAESSAVRTVVPDQDLPTALAQNQARHHVASLVGGPLGGVLYTMTRWLPFAVDAVTFAISCFTLSRLRTPLTPPEREPSSVVADVREGLSYVLHNRFMRTLTFWSAGTNLLLNALLFMLVIRMVDGGTHAASIGFVEAAWGVAGLVGAALAPALIDRIPTGRLTVLVAWSFAPLLVPLIWTAHPVAVAACIFAGIMLNPAGNAGIGAYRLAITPNHLQGRVSSAMQFLVMSAMPFAPLLGGFLLHEFGGAVATAVLVGGMALSALPVTLSHTVRSVPRPAEWKRATTSAEPLEPLAA